MLQLFTKSQVLRHLASRLPYIITSEPASCYSLHRTLTISSKHILHPSLTQDSLTQVPRMGLSSSILNTPQGVFVQDTVKSECVVIFSKTTCGFCHMAKRVFQENGIRYTAVEVNQREDGDQIQDVLSEMTGGSTVPRVFINNKCVGGGQETRDLHKQGKLLDLIKQCQKKALQPES